MKIESLSSWEHGFTFDRDTFVVAVNGERQGRREALDLRYISSAGS